MIPQPKPLKYGGGGKCDICGARGPLTEVSLPSKRHPVMVCIRCYRNIKMRYLFSKKDFDEDDEFQDKWRAENYSFENSVEQMLAVANHLGSVEAAREQWGAAPQVWEEVERRFNESFASANYTKGPNCKCGATLQWSDKKRAWYCVECPFNTFKDAESFEEDPETKLRRLLGWLCLHSPGECNELYGLGSYQDGDYTIDDILILLCERWGGMCKDAWGEEADSLEKSSYLYGYKDAESFDAAGDSCYVCKKEVSVGSPEIGECDDCGAFFHYPYCDKGAGFSDDPMSWFCSPCAKDIVWNEESFTAEEKETNFGKRCRNCERDYPYDINICNECGTDDFLENTCYLCGIDFSLDKCRDCGRYCCTEKGHNWEVYTFTPYHRGDCQCPDCLYRATTETGRVCEPCYRKNWEPYEEEEEDEYAWDESCRDCGESLLEDVIRCDKCELQGIALCEECCETNPYRDGTLEFPKEGWARRLTKRWKDAIKLGWIDENGNLIHDAESFSAESNGDQVKLFYEGIYENDEDEDDERNGQEIESYSLINKQDYIDYYHDTKYEPCPCDVQGCLSCFLDEASHTPAIKEGGITSYGSLWFEDNEWRKTLEAESFTAEQKCPTCKSDESQYTEYHKCGDCGIIVCEPNGCGLVAQDSPWNNQWDWLCNTCYDEDIKEGEKSYRHRYSIFNAESLDAEDKYTQNIKNYGHKKWRHKGRNRPESDATVGKKLEGFKLKPKCTALRSDGFVCGKPIQRDRRDLGDLCGTHHRQRERKEEKDQAEASKHRKKPHDYGPLIDWANKQDFSVEDEWEEPITKAEAIEQYRKDYQGMEYGSIELFEHNKAHHYTKQNHFMILDLFGTDEEFARIVKMVQFEHNLHIKRPTDEEYRWRWEEWPKIQAITKRYEHKIYRKPNMWQRLKTVFSAEDRPEEERMTRPQAEALATKMIGLLQPSCEFIEVCGSFRRGREDPGDLDIVVILKPRETLPKIVEDLEEEHTAVNWLGEKKTQIIVDGVKVDIRVTTDRAKGAALLYFTGPAGYNIGIRRAAKSRGMKLNEYGIWTRDTNEYLGGATEEEIYEILGKNFRPATERRAETITRHLGEISDDELRWLYKNGKITKAQMHIGIGLKMDAEELQEFNSAVIFPSSYRKAGPLEKAVINSVMMTEIRIQEALLTLETNIKMGLISEQEALKTFMKIVG